MVKPAKGSATYQDLVALPEHLVGKIVEGRAVDEPPSGDAARAGVVAPAMEVAPHWVCEVISPSTEAFDRSKKLAAYRRARVAHLWLVNPLAETLEVLRLEAERDALVDAWAGEVAVRAEPFDALPLSLGLLWQR